MIQELADYEKMPDGPKISAETLERDGFGPTQFFQCVVAEKDEEVWHLLTHSESDILFPSTDIYIDYQSLMILCSL